MAWVRPGHSEQCQTRFVQTGHASEGEKIRSARQPSVKAHTCFGFSAEAFALLKILNVLFIQPPSDRSELLLEDVSSCRLSAGMNDPDEESQFSKLIRQD